jgi:general secretion pathway protein B
LSYILDALRRADAERELCAVPSLHTQAAAPLELDDGFDSLPGRSWRWVGLGLGLLAVGVVVWFFFGQRASQPQLPPQPAVVSVAPAAPTVVEPAASPSPLPLVEPTAVPAPVSLPSAAQLPVTAPLEAPQKKVVAAAAAASAGGAKKVPPSVTAPVETKKPTKVAAAVPQDAVMAWKDLPEAIRREQPKLTVGGAMHSVNPANRMLILNGQVFHEGDQVTADLVLEQIKLKSAVLVYKGYRYSISY